MLSELKRSGQGQNITVTVGQSFKRGTIFCYLKWKREHRDLEIEQLMSADTADKITVTIWNEKEITETDKLNSWFQVYRVVILNFVIWIEKEWTGTDRMLQLLSEMKRKTQR